MNTQADPVVRQFRQILLWPVQLMPIREDAQIQEHWEVLQHADEDNAWRELTDEFAGDPAQFQERHYSEFVTFLPYVQRFLYGEGKGRGTPASESPIRVFRRNDVAQVRLTFPGGGAHPTTFDVAHVDLYFFYDIDAAMLVVEIYGRDLALACAQETLYRFGRTYPTFWNENGSGGHCLERVEWLSSAGEVLAVSDYQKRDKFLRSVSSYRAPAIASHWEFLLKPLVPHHSDEKGLIRYRQIEYHRMPLLGYLALDEPRRMTRGDFMRLAFVSAPGESATLPFSERHARDFEWRYCYDRYWNEENEGPAGVRYLCSGHAFMMVGSIADPFFTGANKGLLSQFRHQYFLLFLIPHFHKAALMMLSDRLVDVLNRLDIKDAGSVRRFKRAIRQLKEMFLRFTHRYWFQEVSGQVQANEIFRMCGEHLGTARLYAELRDEIQDMSHYLDSDSLRRQANTVVRLTVVTAFGLIGTITTGFLGMNLISEADNPFWVKTAYFLLVFVPATWLTFYTIVKSKRLSGFLETLADERLPARAKWSALIDVWRGKRRQR